MSYDSLWYDDERWAGPSYNSTPFSLQSPCNPCGPELSGNPLSLVQSPCDSTHNSQKTLESIYTTTRTELPHSQLTLGDDNDCIAEEMLQDSEHHSSRFSCDTSAHDRLKKFTSSYWESSKIESFRIKTEGNDDQEIYLHGPSVVWTTFGYQRDASPTVTTRNHSCSSLSSIDTDNSMDVFRLVTPSLKERDGGDLELESEAPQQSFTSYSPMPLPPVFSHEYGSRINHIPFDIAPPPSISPFLNIKSVESLFIGPSLAATSPGTEDDSPSSPESVTISEYLAPVGNPWPPMFISSSEPLESLDSDCRTDSRPDIPLELAKHLAHQYRIQNISSDAQLPLHFLTSFMGQAYEGPHWKCYIQDCGKHLIRKSHMVDHIRMHLDERVYACEHCPQMFLRKADCKRHSAAHNPDKAFKCNTCTKAFGRKDLLTRHKRKCDPLDPISPIMKNPQLRKRKGRTNEPTFSAEVLQSMFVPGKLFLLPAPPENINTSVGLEFQEPHDANKENIPPFFSTGGMFFNYSGDSGDGRRKKKARTRF